mmetsp:Transcript_4060/g.9128  ORF Transcript_4060/g.9128 Transcript_4060/m.9128 type:complete len:146 (+) Transcript_4060:890-1327(+)
MFPTKYLSHTKGLKAVHRVNTNTLSPRRMMQGIMTSLGVTFIIFSDGLRKILLILHSLANKEENAKTKPMAKNQGLIMQARVQVCWLAMESSMPKVTIDMDMQAVPKQIMWRNSGCAELTTLVFRWRNVHPEKNKDNANVTAAKK